MKITNRLKTLKDRFSYKQKIGLIVCAGILVGLGGLFMYLLRAHTYIADDPSACVNCHIMTPTMPHGAIPLMDATRRVMTAMCRTPAWRPNTVSKRWTASSIRLIS